MSERYFITGVQLGLLKLNNIKSTRQGIVKDIIDNQFIGNFPTEEDKIRFEKMIKELV